MFIAFLYKFPRFDDFLTHFKWKALDPHEFDENRYRAIKFCIVADPTTLSSLKFDDLKKIKFEEIQRVFIEQKKIFR